MTPDEKKHLVAAKLAQLLRSILPQLHMTDEIATQMVEQSGGLWDTMAPLIDGLAVRTVVENTLTRYAGMPLGRSVIDDLMREVDTKIDALSDGHTVIARRGAAHRSSTGLWGGDRDGGGRRQGQGWTDGSLGSMSEGER